MKLRPALLIFATTLTALAPGLFAQPTNHWRAFTQADGLPELACLSVTIGASGNVLIRHPNANTVSVFNGYEITQVPAPETNRSRVYESPGGQLWAAAPEGLLEFRVDQWVLHRVLEIAAYFHAGQTNPPTLYPVRQGRVLVLLPERLLQVEIDDSDQARLELLLRVDQTALGTFAAMTPAADGGLWISGLRGLVKITGPLRSLKPAVAWTPADTLPPELKPWQSGAIPPEELPVREPFDLAVEPGGALWLATAKGLFRRAPAIWEKSERLAPDKPGVQASSVKVVPPGLPEDIAAHADWKSFLIAKYGDVWLGSRHDVAWRHQDVWRIFSSTNQLGPEDVGAFAEAPDGRVWCATPDRVWEFDGKNWLALHGGFERINALHCARNGTLWVATDAGLDRYVRGAWIANDTEDGLPSAVVERVLEDEAGRLAAGTTAGWSEFHPNADLDPPQTLLQPTTGEQSYREGALVTLTFGGRDKWRLTAQDRLLFSHRLDEREWSPFQGIREVSFAELPIGKHYFQVRAMDRNGNIDPNPARLEFAILAPWYRDARLVWILTLALGVAIFFAGLAFNRHRRLQLSYAEVERQVADRTRELELANRELVHSQKMNALGTIAAGIAHDFNNILSIIKGSSQIIEENLDDPTKVRTRLDRIRTVVQQGAGIVEAMLGFSRGSDQSREPCDVNTVVDDTLRLLGDRFLREAEIRFDRGGNLPMIPVARDFVQQVLLNFIFNAAEAMSGRKQIVVTTRLMEAAPKSMVLAPIKAETYIAISVKDAGCGIPPEILPRIFEPFFTTKAMSARRGTGLGLSMVYELAKKVGAGLAVETSVGTGSVFSIFLPVKGVPAAEPRTKPLTVP